MLDQLISHYRITQKLGGGSMGVVYEAEDVRLGRRVAIKFLPEAVASDAMARERFQREARTASALNHPGICTVHDIGEHEGHPFIVMELLEGTTLTQRIAAGAGPDSSIRSPLPLDDVLDYGVQIATALEAAHAAGILHRDIKPANIFITGSGQAKILDFGLAKPTSIPGTGSDSARSASQSSSEDSPTQAFDHDQLTIDGTMMGTAGYMSPEQARGEELDARTDLFSFGAVLYQMSTGQRPFPGRTPAVVFHAILGEQPRPPSEIRPGLPVELERIIGKALEKAPSDRYQHASEIADDLKELRRSLETGTIPLTAAPPEGESHAGVKPPWWRSKVAGWVLTGIGLAIFLRLLLALNPGEWHNRLFRHSAAPGTIHSLAVLPFENLSNDAAQEYLVDGMTDKVITDLAGLPGLTVISRTSVMTYQGSKKKLPEIGSELKVDAILEGSVLKTADGMRITAQLVAVPTDRHLWAQSYEQKSGDVLSLQDEVASDITRQIRSHLQPQVQPRSAVQEQPDPRPVNAEAYDAYLEGRYFWNQRTDAGFEKAIGYFNRAIERDPAYAAAYAGLADTYLLLGENGRRSRPEVYANAREAAQKALKLDEQLAEAHTSLGALDNLQGDRTAAEQEFRRAIELRPGYPTAHQWYAELLGSEGRRDEAIAEINRARELDPLSVLINTQVGYILYLARKYEPAEAQLRRTLEMSPTFCLGHADLAALYLARQTFPQAIAEFRRAEEVCDDKTGVTLQLAMAYALAGQTGEARKILAGLSAPQRRNPAHFTYLALAYLCLGNKQQALGFLKKDIEQHMITKTAGIGTVPLYDYLLADSQCAALLRSAGIISSSDIGATM